MKSASASLLFVFIAGAAAAQASDSGSRSSIVMFAGGNAAMPGSFRGQTVPLQIGDPAGSVVYDDVDADTKSGDPNLALVGLDNTQADVRSQWEYPVELGGVWKFQAA